MTMAVKRCFVICPLGDPKSSTRTRSDQLLKHVIRPVLGALRYEVSRADQMPTHAEPIPEVITQQLLDADLVIADLTDCNPNVLYELGKRHAWGGRTIHFTRDIATLPFDVKHHRVLVYDLENPDTIEQTKEELRSGIKALEATPLQCPSPLTPERVIELTGKTILVARVDGRRDHYYLARELATRPCRRLFVMQRSSSFILGPEQGWGAEQTYYDALMKKIAEGAELHHIVSLEGLRWHLARPQSVFPQIGQALGRLADERGCVGIKSGERILHFKRLPDSEDEKDLKPDRQARTLLVEYDTGECEGILVVDLGGKQACFHLRGPLMADFMRLCIDFYHDCPLLKWSELADVVPEARGRSEPIGAVE